MATASTSGKPTGNVVPLTGSKFDVEFSDERWPESIGGAEALK